LIGTETYLTSGSPNQNHGGETFFRLQSSGKNRGLVFFDSNAIRQTVGTGTFVSATLQLPIDSTGTNWSAAGRPISLHRLKQGSGEYVATWSCAADASIANQSADCAGATAWNMNSTDPNVVPWVSTATATTTITNGQTGTLILDVTADVAAIVENTWGGYGWLLKKVDESQNGSIAFKAHEQGGGPQLVLQVQSATPVDAGSPVDAGTLQTATVVANADSYVRQGQPNQPAGTESILRIQSSGRNRVLLNFDPDAVRAALGSNGLQRARVQLTISKTFANWGSDRAIGAHRLRQSWSEAGATWSCASDADPANQSADCSGTNSWAMWLPDLPQEQAAWVDPPLSTALITDRQTGVVSFDITTELACELAGFTPFNGLLIKKEAEQQSGHIEFASRETATPPTLVLEYRAGAGVVVTSPQCTGLLTDGGMADAGVDAGTCTPHAATDVTCNGLDDDCDGQKDEDYTVTVSQCGEGACRSTGEVSCSNGAEQSSCVAGTPGATDTTCDGIDDDCNGTVDDGYVSVATECGIGSCRQNGTRLCSGGVEHDTCAQSAPASDANCNGLDDDCDGALDEAYPFSCTAECRELVLTASHGGGSFSEGDLAFPASVSVTLPMAAQRVGGFADRGTLTLTYERAPSGESVQCIYLGTPTSGGATRYLFDSCSNGTQAGDNVEVFSLHLRLDDDETESAQAVARMHLERCGGTFGLQETVPLPSYPPEEFVNNPLIAAPTGAHHVLVMWNRGTTWSDIESVLALRDPLELARSCWAQAIAIA
jgi:hypothetical protein